MRSFLTIFICLNAAASLAQSPAIKKVSARDVRMMLDTATGPTIINFWASYCGPCIREIPYFETKIRQSPTPVKLVLVSLDLPRLYPQKFKDFLLRSAYKSDVLLLNESDSEYSAVDKNWSGAIPASVFVDNSKKYYRFFNTQLTEPRLEVELKNMLDYVALPLSSQ